ncbi:MAG: hypothetical protein KDB07_04500, partial [Planctomycetes bacterium]|nr:hypothetical protein [Planctomycetota bacterium]
MVSEHLRREHNKGKRTSLIVLLLAIGLALGVLGVIIVRKYSSGDELPTQPEAQESEAPRRVSGPAQNEPTALTENQ